MAATKILVITSSVTLSDDWFAIVELCARATAASATLSITAGFFIGSTSSRRDRHSALAQPHNERSTTTGIAMEQRAGRNNEAQRNDGVNAPSDARPNAPIRRG